MNAANFQFAKFPIRKNPIELKYHSDGRKYVEHVGRKAAILGKDNGIFEVWVYPFKVVSGLQFSIYLPQYRKQVSCREIADFVMNRPEMTTLHFSHELFKLQLHLLTPLSEPGCLFLFDIESDFDVEIWASFIPELKPMWPAGLGGQYTLWLDEIRSYLITEGSKIYSGLIGSFLAEPFSDTPGHQLPDDPMKFLIRANSGSSKKMFFPLAVAANFESRDKAIEVYKKLFESIPEFYEQNWKHGLKLQQELCSIESDDADFDLAIQWAKVALDKGLVENPHLGSGMVAGYGSSGNTYRPGFAWFFGGDTFINSLAQNFYGDFETVKKSLLLFIRTQREDGKIPHEITQSAALIPWFEKYPYAFYHADTTPFFLLAMADYLQKSGDVDFIRENWGAILKAYQFCKNADEDDDGLMENSAAGLGAMEVGKLLPRTKIDIYLASVWLMAIKSMRYMAGILAETKLQSELDALLEKARASFADIFYDEKHDFLSFSRSLNGENVKEFTVWQSVPLNLGLTESENTLRRLAQSDMTVDWGVRSLSKESQFYNAINYNNGTVWPFTNGFAAGAFYRGHRAANGWQILSATCALTFLEEKGWQAELFSGDFLTPLSTAVPHQLFSASSILTPFYQGLLSLEINAPQNMIELKPHLPAHWNTLKVNKIPVGNNKINLEFRKSANRLVAAFNSDMPANLKISFAPALPSGSHIQSVSLNGSPISYQPKHSKYDLHCEMEFNLEKSALVEIDFSPGIEILQKFPELEKGSSSRNLRFLDYYLEKNNYVLEVQGLSGAEYKLELQSGLEIIKLDGARMVKNHHPFYEISIDFPGNYGSEYATKTLVLHLKKVD